MRSAGPGLRAAARAAVGFAGGALIPFATWLLLLPALGAWGLYGGASIARPVAVLAVACAAGGIVAGGALGGTRWRAAFGAAFCAAAWVPLSLLSGLPALGGGEQAVELAAVFLPGFALAYAALGAGGLALAGCGWRCASLGALVFGGAGAAGGGGAGFGRRAGARGGRPGRLRGAVARRWRGVPPAGRGRRMVDRPPAGRVEPTAVRLGAGGERAAGPLEDSAVTVAGGRRRGADGRRARARTLPAR